MKKNIILAIETTCDETSVALLKNDAIIDVMTYSQIDSFQKIGGVVPQIASDLHVQRLPELIQKILVQNHLHWQNVKLVAYADHPGLEGCLQVARAAAKTIALRFQIPIMALNHIEAHFWIASYQKKITFPVLGVVISGGHTQLFLVKDERLSFQILGSTRDDAAGECLDKIARYLNLGYPGGPVIEKLSQTGTVNIKLPVYQGKDLDFSFSGLKTFCIQWIKKNQSTLNINDFCASLENAIFTTIEKKIIFAIKKYKIKTILAGGGVMANNHLRKKLANIPNVIFFAAEKQYCTDNAAMIGYLAYIKQTHNYDKKNN